MKIKEVLKFAVESDNDQLLDLIHELNSMKPNELGYSEVEKEIAELYCKLSGKQDKDTTKLNYFLNRLYVSFEKFKLVFSEFEKYFYFELYKLPEMVELKKDEVAEIVICFRLNKKELEHSQYRISYVQIKPGIGLENHPMVRGTKFTYLEPISWDERDQLEVNQYWNAFSEDVKYKEAEYDLQKDLKAFADYDLPMDENFISQYYGKFQLEDFKWYNPKNNIKYFGRKWSKVLISHPISTSVTGLIPEREQVEYSVNKWGKIISPVNTDHTYNFYSQVVSPEKYKLKGDLCPFWYQSNKAKYVCFVSQFPVSMMEELSKHQLDIRLQVILKFMVTQTKTETVTLDDGIYGQVGSYVKVKTNHFIPKVWFKISIPEILQSKKGKFSSKDCYKFTNIGSIVKRFYK